LPPAFNIQGVELFVDSSHPNILAILALSDLLKVFGLVGPRKTASDKTESRQNHVTLKLSFYVAQILSTPPAILGRIADEILARSQLIEQEAVSLPSNTTGHHISRASFDSSQVPIIGPDLRQGEIPIKPKIEMLT
jgi:hypothetical protein